MRPSLSVNRARIVCVVAFGALAVFLLNAPTTTAQGIERLEAASFLKPNPEMTARFPTKPVNPLGWTMRVQASSHSTADAMRIEMDFATTGGPTTADQNVTVRLTPIPSGQAPPQSSLVVTLPIEIPQGTKRLRIARHAPKASYGNYYLVQLYQNGRKIDDCRANLGEAIAYRESSLYFNQAAQSRGSLLWVNDEKDQTSRLDSFKNHRLRSPSYPFYTANTPNGWEANLGSDDLGNDEAILHTIDSNDMPNSWLAYRPYDCVVMHVDQWNEIQTLDTPSANAFRVWNQSGGVVMVRGGSVSDRSRRIKAAEVAEVGSIPTLESIKNAEALAGTVIKDFADFTNPNSSRFQSLTTHLDLSEDQVGQWRAWFPEGGQTIRDSLDAYPPESITAPNGVRAEANLAGLVIHLGKQEPDAPIQILQWASADYLMNWKRHRLLRSGAEPILGSSRFFQWGIPGVAQPPVYTFMGLLGVFVILVGPVAYRKTAKSGRSYLMFAIAPMLAIATTLAMLVYGVIADGFGTQTRVRQITWVDGQTGNGITRTRSTYFAGIRPSAGLSFPANADVTLYPDNQQRSWEARMEDRFDPRGEVIVTDETIRFTQDFLPSRQQRQFVMHQPSSFSGRLTTEELPSDVPGNAASTIGIFNQFDRGITEVLICDSKGNYYFADRIDPKGKAMGNLLEDKEASERLGEMYKRQWLVSSVVDRRESRGLSLRRSNNETFDLLSEQLNQVDSVAKPTDGVFEFELQMRMQLGSKLPSNSFLCLTALTDDSIAVKEATATESIHFVMGSLP